MNRASALAAKSRLNLIDWCGGYRNMRVEEEKRNEEGERGTICSMRHPHIS
jgi:hypothetical protein